MKIKPLNCTNTEYEYKKEYVLLEIYVPTHPMLRLFMDGEADGCVYSLDNINPENIKVLNYYQLNEKGRIVKVLNN